jgi:hypothetical protein
MSDDFVNLKSELVAAMAYIDGIMEAKERKADG